MQSAFGTVAVAGLIGLLAAPVFAQVTPEDVWQGWQQLGTSYGQTVTAEEVARDGDTLVVKGMTTQMAREDLQFDGKIDELRFRDLKDGTVEVKMTDTYKITMVLPTEEGEAQEVSITLTHPQASLIAGGDSTQTSYTYDAPSMVVDMVVTEAALTLANLQATLTNVSGTYLLNLQDNAMALDSALEMDSLSFSIEAGDAETSASVTGTMAALKVASEGNFLGVAAMEDMAQALRDGFVANTELTYGQGDYTLDVMDKGKPSKFVASNETGHLRFKMGDDALQYAAGGTGVSMAVSGADIPFPEIRVAYGEASFDFLIPLLASDTPTDFSLLTRIVDLTVSDEIWAMFDPTVALPRSPATLVLDAKGKVKLTADLLDEEAVNALGGASPAEMHALDMTDLTVKFAGAELTGTGAMTFDNTDMTSFDGIPAPTGKIDLRLKGGNGLLDKLVTMGVIPQDQAMGARMMIAMFAKPGEGDDVLNASLEFRDKGFFANGQRLK